MDKDLSAKAITRCPDVFSDICNVNLFGGEQILRPEQLEPLPIDSVYKDGSGVLREHRRDVSMCHRDSGTDTEVVFCLENQSGVCRTMPVRDMGYLYSGYQDQIRRIRERDPAEGVCRYAEGIGKDQKLVPVISLVLYYGTGQWDGACSLYEMLRIPDGWKDRLEPLVCRHPVRIIPLASQSRETREKYQSDFRHIVDYLAYVKQKDYEKLREYMRDPARILHHPEEYLDFMRAFTTDKRYGKIARSLSEKTKKEGGISMCIMLDMLEEEGRQAGIAEGRREGKREGKREGLLAGIVQTCQEFGGSLADTVQRVADKFGLSEAEAAEEVNRYWK